MCLCWFGGSVRRFWGPIREHGVHLEGEGREGYDSDAAALRGSRRRAEAEPDRERPAAAVLQRSRRRRPAVVQLGRSPTQQCGRSCSRRTHAVWFPSTREQRRVERRATADDCRHAGQSCRLQRGLERWPHREPSPAIARAAPAEPRYRAAEAQWLWGASCLMENQVICTFCLCLLLYFETVLILFILEYRFFLSYYWSIWESISMYQSVFTFIVYLFYYRYSLSAMLNIFCYSFRSIPCFVHFYCSNSLSSLLLNFQFCIHFIFI